MARCIAPLWGQEPQTATRVKRMGGAPPPREPQEWLGAFQPSRGSPEWSLEVKSLWSQLQLTD